MLFICYSCMNGRSICILFIQKRSENYLNIHGRRGAMIEANWDRHTVQSYTLTSYGSPRHPARAFTIITATIAASIDRPKGGSRVRHRITSSYRHASERLASNVNTFKCIQEVSIPFAASIHILFICILSE